MPQKLEIEDFGGGITDYYLNAPENKLKFCDNMLLIQYQGKAKPFTRPGSSIWVPDAPQLPTGNQRVSTAFFFDKRDVRPYFFAQSTNKLYWILENLVAWTEVQGPTGNPAFNGATTSSVFTYGFWNHHVLITSSEYWYPQKIVIQQEPSGEPVLFEAGLPKIDSSGIIATPTAGSNEWLYKFVYKQTYATKDNILFVDYGAPSAPVAASSAATTVAITNIPEIDNGATRNYLTGDLVVEIYRTTDAGGVFYLVGEIPNGTNSYNDNTSDASLLLQPLLYTEGGVVANDAPPRCNLVHIFGDTAYFADIELEDGQKLKYRLQQSIPGDIDAAPGSFFLDIDDAIVGLSSTRSNLCLLGDRSVYRVDGFYDELGRGGMVAERISDTATCISAQSVVQTLDGIFWAGSDGIYWTDGFRVIKLNSDFDKTYAEFADSATKRRRIQGKYDKRKNRIWWTVQHESGTDVDKCYVLDLNWGVRENATFTTISGLSSFSPTAIEFYDGDLYRGDRRGYVLKHSSSLFSDPKIDTTVDPDDWVQQTIFYTLESIAFNFGTSFVRKYVTGINVTCDSVTSLSLQIISNNDDNRQISNLSPIRYRGNIVWGNPDIYWGDPEITWNLDGLISEKRNMPARNLRCNYKSVKFENAFVAITSSDSIGTVDVDAVAKTVTLTNMVYTWPTNSVDWVIAFEDDDYTTEFTITARTDDVLTYSDVGNESTSETDVQWVIRGYPKDEILNLINYALHFEMFGQTQQVFQKSGTGEVGASDS